MSHQLRLTYTPPPKQVEGFPLGAPESPVGWWSVTLVYDDGRCSNDAGMFFGHFAEVAFHVAGQGLGGRIEMLPIKGQEAPVERPRFNTSCMSVSVELALPSVYSMTTAHRCAWMRKWLDVECLDVIERAEYGCVELKLNNGFFGQDKE